MKVLFAIISCHKNAARRQAQRDTWLPSLKEDYKYFLGRGEGELKVDEVQLDVSDDYVGLPVKVQAVFKWALEQDYDYICKLDDDVYLFPGKMMSTDFQHDYVGRLNGWKNPSHPKSFLSGFAYWVSRKAAQMIVDTPTDPMITYEDRWVGGTLGKAGIQGINDKSYVVMSMTPRAQWQNIVRQNHSVLCQFEPSEMKYVHLLVNGHSPPQPPASGRTRQVIQRNPRIIRMGKLNGRT